MAAEPHPGTSHNNIMQQMCVAQIGPPTLLNHHGNGWTITLYCAGRQTLLIQQKSQKIGQRWSQWVKTCNWVLIAPVLPASPSVVINIFGWTTSWLRNSLEDPVWSAWWQQWFLQSNQAWGWSWPGLLWGTLVLSWISRSRCSRRREECVPEGPGLRTMVGMANWEPPRSESLTPLVLSWWPSLKWEEVDMRTPKDSPTTLTLHPLPMPPGPALEKHTAGADGWIVWQAGPSWGENTHSTPLVKWPRKESTLCGECSANSSVHQLQCWVCLGCVWLREKSPGSGSRVTFLLSRYREAWTELPPPCWCNEQPLFCLCKGELPCPSESVQRTKGHENLLLAPTNLLMWRSFLEYVQWSDTLRDTWPLQPWRETSV